MKKFLAKVIKDKMNKTVTVELVRLKAHPIYKKRIKIGKKYHVHNEMEVKVGDQVVIAETKPISKTKKWKIIKVVKG